MSIKIAGAISLGLVCCVFIIMIILNKLYIQKISTLELRMREFMEDKNSDIAEKIKKEAVGNNEISWLYRQFAELILELERHVNNLLSARRELKDTKLLAHEMNELAKKRRAYRR